MGIHNREYMRPGQAGFSGWSGRDMVKTILIVNIVVFILQVVWMRPLTMDEISQRLPQWEELTESEQRELYREVAARRDLRVSVVQDWFELDPERVLRGQIWRLTTYDFLHSTGDIWHIVFNMYILWLAGTRVQSMYGPKEFLAFYLAAGVISGIGFLLWGLFLRDLTPAIGASGAVAAVMIVYALHRPNEVWLIWGILPLKVIWIAALTAALDLFPMLRQLGGSMASDGIAHSAHIGGMLFGLLYQRNNWRVLDWLPQGGPRQRRSFFSRRPKLRVVNPEPASPRPSAVDSDVSASLEARVDAILAKLHEQGESSLTQEERELLADASRRYRTRGR